jgi:predicted nucleic acid-binding protein
MSGPVVSDAGPLHYLILVDCADALSALFDQLLIPPEVRYELLHSSTPQKVKDWMVNPPPWLKVEPVDHLYPLASLHKGETAALQLALQTKTSSVLMDDLDGRAAARRLGLIPIGTVGCLERMAELRKIELTAVISKLRQTNIFISPELLEAALERDRRRRMS